jgi:hypothetical protein
MALNVPAADLLSGWVWLYKGRFVNCTRFHGFRQLADQTQIQMLSNALLSVCIGNRLIVPSLRIYNQRAVERIIYGQKIHFPGTFRLGFN